MKKQSQNSSPKPSPNRSERKITQVTADTDPNCSTIPKSSCTNSDSDNSRADDAIQGARASSSSVVAGPSSKNRQTATQKQKQGTNNQQPRLLAPLKSIPNKIKSKFNLGRSDVSRNDSTIPKSSAAQSGRSRTDISVSSGQADSASDASRPSSTITEANAPIEEQEALEYRDPVAVAVDHKWDNINVCIIFNKFVTKLKLSEMTFRNCFNERRYWPKTDPALKQLTIYHLAAEDATCLPIMRRFLRRQDNPTSALLQYDTSLLTPAHLLAANHGAASMDFLTKFLTSQSLKRIFYFPNSFGTMPIHYLAANIVDDGKGFITVLNVLGDECLSKKLRDSAVTTLLIAALHQNKTVLQAIRKCAPAYHLVIDYNTLFHCIYKNAQSDVFQMIAKDCGYKCRNGVYSNQGRVFDTRCILTSGRTHLNSDRSGSGQAD